MPRRRVYGLTTTERYISKLQKVFEARGASPDQAAALARLASATWNLRFGSYKVIADEVLARFADRIPRPLRGLYRAATFRLIKAVRKGENIEAVIEYFALNGLNREILEDIADEITARRETAETAPQAPPS